MNHLQIGYWELDLQSRKMICTAPCKTIFGLAETDEFTYEKLLSLIHDDDLPLMQQQINNVIAHQTDNYNTEYRIEQSNGTMRWIKADGWIILDDNKLARLAGTIQDITDRKLSDLRKEELLSIVTHEINTPLTGIKGYLQLLERMLSASDNTKASQVIERAIKSSERLENILSDYFSHYKSSTPERLDRLHDFRLDELIKEIADNIQTIASTHQIIIRNMPEVWVHGDRQDLGQVLSNLLTNAIKYSPDHDAVHVDLQMDTKNATVCITDYGMGIAQINLDKLFNKSYRVNNYSAITGSGMGLYICREIINRHKGRIGVQSVEGKGSTFHFTLPII
ncbi:PAS domain-containing sensor histidine kinase [Mucilaginibacter lacusdianchii]|uniref:PAS domain-containing sensor histidine kinase n=1 Tax=Mucilaginibacter lacusdianchii TaxID=2684211 RepID=UPI00131CC43F|nr:PAS domain-containing sensor histidine kinase [Mucilaginibacter sp. JXJ CY 39]